MHTAVAVDGDALHGAWLDVIGKHYLFGHASALSSQVYLHPNRVSWTGTASPSTAMTRNA